MAAGAPISVLGAGSWGTALAILLARNGHAVRLWGHNPQALALLAEERCNRRYLSDIPFPDGLILEPDLGRCMAAGRDLLVAVPSHAFRATLEAVRGHAGATMRVAWATKGLEPGSYRLLHEVAAEILGPNVPLAVISGPTFAREVAAGMPTAVTIAATSAELAADLAERLHGPTFRAYTSEDLIGVQLGGAVKNVLALAAGISDGLRFGANSRAALITRGLAEMMRLGVALGGQRETFMGLAGLGDLVLTCTDDQSRNRRVGLALGRGETLTQALAAVDQVVEGVRTAPVVLEMAAATTVEMPIVEQVCRVLGGMATPQGAVEALLAREQKAEAL